MRWEDRGLDPITMELIKNGLQAVVDEASFTLERTCASQLIKDAQDFSVGLCDEHGDLVAVSITAPSQIGVIPAVMKLVIERYRDDMEAGDVFIVNDPYHGGSHLNDLHIMKPVFHEGRIFAYATSKAHHSDVGGRVPGSMAFDNTEIFQEGLRIPPLKLFRRGEPNKTLMKIIELNVRYPDVLFADVNAQVTSLATAERGLVEMAVDHGPDRFRAYLAGLLDYGEALARAQIATWPDGSAEFEDYCDDDGVTGKPVVFHARVTVQGEEVAVDFTGTSPQVPAAINFPPYESASRGQLIVRCCLTGDLPNNSGVFRSVSFVVPRGTLLNPLPPAPCSERGLVTYRVGDVLMGAFAQIAPHGVTAAGEGGSYLMRISGTTAEGRPFLCVDLVQGTWGARQTKDGIDALSSLQANHTNTPIEVVEANFPIRIESHTLVPDTGGLGKHRGGLAIERSWRYLGRDKGVFRSRSDRRKFPPYGLFGGHTGTPSRLVLERDGQPPVEQESKAVIELRPGDLVRLTIASGGGWGDPLERDPERVLKDVREEKVSLAHARDAYGMVIDERTLTVDWLATERLRAGPAEKGG